MKKLLLPLLVVFLLLTVTSVYAGNISFTVSTNKGAFINNDSGVTAPSELNFTFNITTPGNYTHIMLNNVTILGGGFTQANLTYGINNTVIATGTILGNVATFNINLTNGTFYKIKIDNMSSNWTRSAYNWTGPVFGGNITIKQDKCPAGGWDTLIICTLDSITYTLVSIDNPPVQPNLSLSINDTRTNTLVSGFTANVSNASGYSTLVSTTGTIAALYAGRTNSTNSSLYLPLNNASYFNGSYRDQSPNQLLATLQGKTLYHGTLVRNPIINGSGRYGNGVNFDGTDKEIAPTLTSLNLSNPYTICSWVQFYGNLSAISMIVSGVGTNNNSNRFRFGIDSANRTFIQAFNSSGASLGQQSITLSSRRANYNYYCVGYNGTNQTVALNGTLQFRPGYLSNPDQLVNLTIARSSGTTLNPNATIDETRVWTASLNSSEMIAEMNSDMPVRGADLILSYSYELNNITAGAPSNTTADTNYLVNGSRNGDGAYYFDSVNDYLDAGNVSSFNLPSNGFTIRAVGKIDRLVSTGRMVYRRSSNSGYLLQYSGGNWVFFTGNGSTNSQGTIAATANVYADVVGVWNGTNSLLYVNGVLQNVGSTILNGMSNSNTNLIIGGEGGSNGFNGSIGRLQIYSRALSADEVWDLYEGQDFSSGVYNVSFVNVSGGTYFNTSLQNVNFIQSMTVFGQDWSNYINFTLTNLVNGASLSNFTVTVTNGTTVHTNSTTVGSLVLYNLIGNLTINYTAVEGSTYFNKTGVVINTFNASNYNVTNSTYQGFGFIQALRLFLNTTITTFNVTNNQAFNTTTNSFLYVPLNVGSNTIKVDVPGNYSQNYTCTLSTALGTANCNATGIFDNLFTIGGNASGVNVNTFTVNVTNQTLGGLLYSTSTTNGSITFPLLQGYYYYFYMSPPQYSNANATLPANASTNRYNFSILTQNAFDLNFYNESSDTPLINVNITVQIISETFAQNYTTSNGSLIVGLLTPEDYTIRYWMDPAVPRDYYVTLTNLSYNNITLYIVDAGISNFYLPVVNNEYTRPLSDVTVSLLRYYVQSNNYKIVEMAKTDTNGQAVLRVVPNTINYKLLLSDGTNTVTTTPTKFTATTNTYTLSGSTNVLTSLVTIPSVSKSLSFNNATSTYTFTWTDTQNLVTQGCMVVTEYNTTGTYVVQNTCSTGSTGSIIYTITNTNNTRYSATATLETNTEFSTYTFGPLEVDYDMTARDIFGLTGFIILLLVLLTAGFLANDIGTDATIWTTLLTLLGLGVLNIIGYTWTSYIGIAIIGFILLYKTYR